MSSPGRALMVGAGPLWARTALRIISGPYRAVVAARTHHSIVSRLTGRSLNMRTLRRVRIVS